MIYSQLGSPGIRFFGGKNHINIRHGSKTKQKRDSRNHGLWDPYDYVLLYHAILYYTILYYTILYYTILYYTILYYTILYYTILYYTILYYTILYYTILYYTILYYTILYYTILSSKLRAPLESREAPEFRFGVGPWPEPSSGRKTTKRQARKARIRNPQTSHRSPACGCFQKTGLLFVSGCPNLKCRFCGCLLVRALLFGVYIGAQQGIPSKARHRLLRYPKAAPDLPKSDAEVLLTRKPSCATALLNQLGN